MDEKDFEELARLERERAEAEMTKMQTALKKSSKKLDKQQKHITEKVINENLEEHNAKKSTVWIFLLLALILGGSYLRLNVQRPKMQYADAAAYFENGEYDAARDAFSKLGDYNDAKEMVKECDYRSGSLALANGRYNSAINDFSRIVDYKDRNDVVADLSGTAVNTIATGARHSAFVRSIGTVKAIGDNSNGQCNVTEWKQVAEIACGADFTLARTADGRVLATNAVLDWRNIREIAAGRDFAVGIDNSGTLYRYQNGTTTKTANIKTAKACGDILACVTTSGTAVVSGAAIDVSPWSGLKDIATDGKAVYGLKTDGNVLSTNGRLMGLGDIKQIFAAADTFFAVDRDNRIHIDGVLTEKDLAAADAVGRGSFNFTLMLSGYTDHCLVLDHTGKVHFLGTPAGGNNNTHDWSDIYFVPKQNT